MLTPVSQPNHERWQYCQQHCQQRPENDVGSRWGSQRQRQPNNQKYQNNAQRDRQIAFPKTGMGCTPPMSRPAPRFLVWVACGQLFDRISTFFDYKDLLTAIATKSIGQRDGN